MRGYFIPTKPYEPVTEQALVGCKRCRNTWYEAFTFTNGLRINSAMMLYDICDKCKTGSEPERK